MCGIGGIFGDPEGVDRAAMRAALRHRGPDSEGEIAPRPEVWLCAARLAMNDLTPRGNQPMVRGPLTLVYNGEIDNASALAHSLGDALTSGADTEVILAGYRRWGEAVVERLEGMFAFALWDDAERRLVLARDPLGIKPLWLARERGRVLFASEVRALLAAGTLARRLDPAAIDRYLATGSVADSAGLVAGVAALPPGTVEVLGSAPRQRRYFELPEPRAGGSSEAVTERLREAVPRSFSADVPVALLLSDGIDSAALAHLAGGQRSLHSFHVALEREGADLAATRARSLGLVHTEVPVDAHELGPLAQAWLDGQDLPSIDGLNTYVVCRAIRAAGLKAAVTGLGGDELFLGYPRYFTAHRLRHLDRLRLGPVRRGARALARLEARWAPARGRRGWQLSKAVGAFADPAPLHESLRVLFPTEVRRTLGAHIGVAASAPPRGCGAVAAARADLTGYLVETLLRDTDAASMAHGVELRVPLLDVRLVEMVSALPERMRLAAGRKGLLLDAVPELRAEAARPKRGFELPMERLLRGPLAARLDDTLRARTTVEDSGLDPAAVVRLVDGFVTRPTRPAAFRLLALFALCSYSARHRLRV